MGCLNNKVQTEKLPNAPSSDQPTPASPSQLPKSVAFEIPNDEIKIRKAKPARLNKQLYIIREVSNVNHELVQSPLKQSRPKQQQQEQGIPEQVEQMEQVEQLEPESVKVRPHRRTRTTKALSNRSDHSSDATKNKTDRFIPQEHQEEEEEDSPNYHAKAADRENRSRKSDNRSQLSQRYVDETPPEGGKRRRKASLSVDSEHTYRSIHFKRAKTFHAEEELVHPTKSASINKAPTDARSAPQSIEPNTKNQDIEAEIKQITETESEESPKLLHLLHSLTQKHERNGKLQQALTANSKQLRLARRISGVDSCNYAAGLSNLSSIHYSLQDYEKAIENSMKAKSIRAHAAVEGHMHKARVLNEIGLIELEQNHLKEATHYLEEVRDIHAKVAKEFDLTLQELIPRPENESRGESFGRSVESMQGALRVCLRAFGENNLQTANHLDDLGTSYCDAGRYEECLQCYRRCFAIVRCMRLAAHKDYAAHSKHFFYNLEVLRLAPDCPSPAYRAAVEILETYFPENGLISELKAKN